MSKKLKTPLVKEVVFEIRFSSKKSALDSLFFFQEKLAKEELHRKTIIEGDLPVSIAQYRLLTKDEKKIVSIGKGILSVHALEHVSFDSFFLEITKYLELLREWEGDLSIERLGLRYVNEIILQKGETPSDILNEKLITDLEDGTSKAFNNCLFLERGEMTMSLRTIKKEGDEVIFLDLDIYQAPAVKMDPEKWVIVAHKELFPMFEMALKDSYFEKLK